MSAGLEARGLTREELSHTYMRYSVVWKRLGFARATANRWVEKGTFPLHIIREGRILYCYSAEVDAHMRGDHSICYHGAPNKERAPVDLKTEQIVRNFEIARLATRGITRAEIARRFGLSPQRVTQIIERWALDGADQGDDDDDESEEP
jgi:predicted DNA-binding transcriptional regulator AlpA